VEPEPVLSDPVLRAVSLFGARLRGHGSDHDTPEVHAWLAAQAADDGATVPPGEPSWRTWARAVDRRLPHPARRAARAVIGRVRA
jgi:hypothetical protein